MPETPSSEKTSGGEGLMIGGAAFAMIACCGLPLIVVLASSIAIGTLLSVGGGLLAAVALMALAAIRVRARRRACASRPQERQPALRPRR